MLFAEYYYPGYWVFNKSGEKEAGPYEEESDAIKMADSINFFLRYLNRPNIRSNNSQRGFRLQN